MKTLLRTVVALVMMFALAVAIAALVASQIQPWYGTVSVNDEAIVIQGLGDLDGSHAALGIALGTVAVVGALLLAIVAVAVGLAAAVVGIATALLAVAGSLLLVASPLLFIAWLVWLAVRQPPAPATPTFAASA